MAGERVDQRRGDPGAASAAAAAGGLRAISMLAVSLGYFSVILDATIVTVALPSLGQDLGSSVAALQWVVDAYTASLAGLLLLGGSPGDRLGSRALFLAALAGFHGRLGGLRAGALARRADRRSGGPGRRRGHDGAVLAGAVADGPPRHRHLQARGRLRDRPGRAGGGGGQPQGSFTPGMELAMLLAAVAFAAGAVVSSTTLRRHRAE